MKSQRCKGMQDMLPGDMLRFRHIEDIFRSCCHEWGYQEVRTPTLEYLHLFTATGTLTPSKLGRVYSFLDWDGWSGERVVLRPDGTIPVARLYIDNLSDHEIARLFYVTNIFAFEGTGRENRERWQCGAEFLGGSQFATDVEIILLAREVINKLGLNGIELQLSHAGLVKAIIKELKLSPNEEAKVMDKVIEGDWEALKLIADSSQSSITNGLLPQFLSLKGKSSNFLQNIRALFPQASSDFKSSLEDFINIAAMLDSLNCNYEIDFKAIQGFEYYTGVCFQLSADRQKIGGGGRYDNLLPLMSGRETPACGFALYVEPIAKILPLQVNGRSQSGILIKCEELTPEVAKRSFTLAQSLHDAGHMVELGLSERREPEHRWVILISEKETSPFGFIDRQTNRRQDVASVAELLSLLAE